MRPRSISRRQLLLRTAATAGAVSLQGLTAACHRGRSGGGSYKPAPAPASRPVRGGTLTVRSSADVSILDYAYNHDVYSGFALSNCVEALVRHDSRAQATGLLATNWENPDDLTYVFRIRPGVRFQDGTELGSEAVEYSLNRIRGDKASIRYTDLTPIAKLERPDRLTLRVTLNNPFAPFLEKLTGDAGRVISPAVAERYGKDRLKVDLTDQGTGPFRFTGWKPAEGVNLVRNEQYWGRDSSTDPLPYLDRIAIRIIPDDTIALAALRRREIDAFRPTEGAPPKDAPSIKVDKSLNYGTAPGLGYSYLGFNHAREPFSSRELRQAVSLAIDREVIAKKILYGTVEPLDTIFGPSTWAYDAGFHPYLTRDVARARQLVAQAGRGSGFGFTYLTSSGSPELQLLAELVKDQLQEAGIEMTIQSVEFAKLTQVLNEGAYQAAFLGWTASYDPDEWVYGLFSSKGSLAGRSHYSNSTVDGLLDQARTTLDPGSRAPLYQQAQRLILGDAAACLLYNKQTFSLCSGSVRGYPLGTTAAVGLSEVWKSQ